MRRSLTVVAATAVLMAVMMATMVASAGMASAAECGRGCENPPPVPSGASNVNAFAHANPNAHDALLNNAAKRQGAKGSGCDGCTPA